MRFIVNFFGSFKTHGRLLFITVKYAAASMFIETRGRGKYFALSPSSSHYPIQIYGDLQVLFCFPDPISGRAEDRS
jgi:hypothetical protein